MKTDTKIKELLSAYIDGELSPKEKEYIEEKISSSLELQKELADLKRLKELTASAYERLPEAPFFQTRLNAELAATKPFYSKIKKWIPAIGVTFLTAALMITLKVNPDLIKNVIEEQSSNLVNLYKENLQPLLYAANLTNEDIFNFAFYSELPLDETNQHYLRLGYDPNGAEYFEIKKSDSQIKEKNFEKFVQALDLNELQRKEMDSIINSYSDELMAQVLVSDKNTVAINPNLWNYQKAIAADILAFAKSKNVGVYNNIIPSGIRPPENIQLAKFVRELRPSREDRYIFFTPDSIFTDTFVFDDKAFRKELIELEKELVDMNKMEKERIRMDKNLVRINYQIRIDTTLKRLEKDSSWAKDFTVHIDANKFKVNIPNIVIRKFDVQMPNMDSINIIIQDALKNVEKFSIKIPDHKSITREFKIEMQNGDSLKIEEFNFNENMIDSIMKNQFPNLDSSHGFNFDPFKFFSDSTSGGLNYFFNDSSMFDMNEDLKKQMQELREELRKFREEMRYYQNDQPNQPDTVKPKLKGIEI